MNKFTAAGIGVPFLPLKSMIAIFNGNGSGKTLKVWQISFLNNQSVGVAGVLTELRLLRITSLSGGNPITPTKHDTAITTLPTNIIVSSGATVANTEMIDTLLWSSDEPSAILNSIDEWETIPKYSSFFEVDSRQSRIEPIVLREGFGISVLQNNTFNQVGSMDIFIDFSVE